MRLIPLGSAALAVLLIAACDDGRHSPGFLLGADGQPRYNNAANARAETEHTIERSLDHELAPRWRSQVAVADEPRWDDRREAWLWPATSVTVELSGDPSFPPALDAATITSAVEDYFATRLADPAVHIQVMVAQALPSPVVKPAVLPTPAPTPAPVAAVVGQRYTIQPGDTLARISAVFYGSTQHWRRLVEANPGLAPEALPVGKEIVIPPAPTAP